MKPPQNIRVQILDPTTEEVTYYELELLDETEVEYVYETDLDNGTEVAVFIPKENA